MLEIMILGAIAAFVLFRLYSVLGSDEGPPEGRPRVKAAPPPTYGPRDGLPDTPAERPVFHGPGSEALEAIYEADNSFSVAQFKQGARSAYKAIVDAFARGDTDSLRPLLDDDVFEAWSAAIAARADDEPVFELLRFRRMEIVNATFEGGIARIDVLYEAELGDGETVREAREVWTYMRAVPSADPNWILDEVALADSD